MSDTTPPNDDLDRLDVEASEDLVAIRGYAKRLEKKNTELRKANDGHELKLAELEKTSREALIEKEASKVGLSTEQLQELLKIRPDADAEAVSTFAKALGVEPKVEGESAPADGEAAPAPDAGKPVPPVAGSPAPKNAVTSEDIAAAVKRGDMDFVEKAVADAVAHPERLHLKHGDLIPD